MENVLSSGIKATLTIKQSELSFVIQLLDALKLRGLVEFRIEANDKPEPEFREMSVKELNNIIEKSEKSADLSLEYFKTKYQL